VDAPVQKLSLFIRAGSIVPLGPEIEYAGQMPDAPIEIRIYRGADGSFNLYEDQGDGYQYEHGDYALIPIHWNDSKDTLTFGDRVGAFAGMANERTFRVVLVGPEHGSGESISSSADAVVKYLGKSKEVAFPPNRPSNSAAASR